MHRSIGAAALGLCAGPASADPDFFAAVRTDDFARVERLLADGVAPNALTASLLHAESGPMITRLAEAGADLDRITYNGGNALHWAAHDGKVEVLEALIVAGADVNAVMTSPRHGIRNYRNTALHLAIHGDGRAAAMEMAPLLVAAGADVNAASSSGSNALHFAAWQNPDPVLIEFLLDAGVDFLARSGKAQSTPYQWLLDDNPRIARTRAGQRLERMTRRAGLDEPGCDGVVVQHSDTTMALLADRVLGDASRWKEIVELNGLRGRGYRRGQCLALP